MDRRDIPSAVVELLRRKASPRHLAGFGIHRAAPRRFTSTNRTYQLDAAAAPALQAFSIQLLDSATTFIPGTEIPKNFSSRVLLQRPDTGEKREVLIYMNNPLRYAGETFYQAELRPR